MDNRTDIFSSGPFSLLILAPINHLKASQADTIPALGNREILLSS